MSDASVAAVVVADEWLRRGLAHALHETRRELALVADHGGVLADGIPPDVDSYVVEAIGGDDEWDRVAGVEVVRTIREIAPETVIVGLVPYQPPGLIARRMIEAGATHVVHRQGLGGVQGLTRLLADRSSTTSLRDLQARHLGVHDKTRLNAAFDFIREEELEGRFLAETPDLTRRQMITLRSKLSVVMALEPVTAGSSALIERTTPSWRQIREVLDLARGAHLA